MDQNDITSDIIYSLPAVGHSTGITTSKPTSGTKLDLEYLPDHGGILETRDSQLKQCCLNKGLPFSKQQRTSYVKFHDEVQAWSMSSDCIESFERDDNIYTVISAIGKTLNIDDLRVSEQIDCKPELFSIGVSTFKNYIHGIKLTCRDRKDLIVRFRRSVKVARFANPDLSDDAFELFDQAPAVFDNSMTYKLDDRSNIKDAALNLYNENKLAIASDRHATRFVRLYDLKSESISDIISWDEDTTKKLDNSAIQKPKMRGDDRVLRGRIVRTFVPNEEFDLCHYGLKHLDHNPHHICNLIATTSHQTSIIDPRCKSPARILVDRASSATFYLTEFLLKSVYSTLNEYQFYALSNVHLRVLDTRFSRMEMSQSNLMLDPDDYHDLNLRVHNHKNDNIESTIISSSDRLCLLTYEHDATRQLVNPKSLHYPYHTKGELNDVDRRTHGLSIQAKHSSAKPDELRAIQITSDNLLKCTIFSKTSEHDDDYLQSSDGHLDLNSMRKLSLDDNAAARNPTAFDHNQAMDLLRPCKKLAERPKPKYLDLVNDDRIDYENQLSSQRAKEMFDVMKAKLDE